MTSNLIEEYLLKMEKALDSLLIVTRERFKSWENNPKYEEQLRESFEVMREHAGTLSPEIPLRMCEVVLETRMLWETLISSYKKGEFPGALLTGLGQEAIGAGAALTLRKDDWLAPDHRSASAALARGTSTDIFFLNHFMRATGPTGGYDPNLHLSDLEHNNIGFLTSDMAMGTSILNGAVSYRNLERELEKGLDLTPDERIAGIAISGDGAASSGMFLAALNFAKARRIPILEIILDNQISLGTSGQEQHGGIDLSNRGLGFEVPSITIDGDDALEVYLASYWLLHFVRHAQHPALLNAITFRRSGHNETESKKYTEHIFDKDTSDRMMSPEADPLTRIRKICEDLGVFTQEYNFTVLRDRVRDRVATAYKAALEAPHPNSEREAFRNVFTDPECRVSKDLAQMYPAGEVVRKIDFKNAFKEALAEELQHDPVLQILGEDVGFPKGGVFDVTSTLPERFGLNRVFNSTLDESAIGCFAVGAALAGGRVVAEYQFANFFLAAPSPILTLAANQTFMRELSIPIVLRAPTGFAPTSNHYHENWIEAYLAKALGVKVVIPATAADAKGLLRSAVRDPDPVFVLEEMSYYGQSEEIPDGEYFTPLGVAAIRKQGNDITLVTWGPKLLRLALDAAQQLSEKGIELEVIDLRTLVPWDKETVFDSVKKTGRAIILYEDSKFMGFGAEISATISEELLFYSLKARVRRLAALNTPIPANPDLENARLPGLDDILSAVGELMEES